MVDNGDAPTKSGGMLYLALTACLLETPAIDSALDSGTPDTAEDTAPVDDTDAEVYWIKYKVDSAATVRGVYSSGAGVYLVATTGLGWVGSATDEWLALVLPPELAGVDLNSLWATGAEDTLEMAIAADNGLVAIYSLGAWTVHNLGARDNLTIAGTSVANLYAGGENGVYHWDGVAWAKETSNEPNALWAWEGGAVAVGNEGNVMFRDGTGVWTVSATGKTANLRGVSGSSATDIWAVGDLSVLLHWDGSAWESDESDSIATLNAVFVADEDGAIAVGNAGTALKYNGKKWSILPTDTNQNIYAVHGVSGANAWGTGDAGLAMQYKE